MTKDGIEYNFNITPWTVEKKYNGCILTYKFSSELYKNKFILNTKDNFKKVDKKLKTIGVNYEIGILEDIKEYVKVEKRGFQIVTSHLNKINSIKDLKIKSTFDVY